MLLHSIYEPKYLSTLFSATYITYVDREMESVRLTQDSLHPVFHITAHFLRA